MRAAMLVTYRQDPEAERADSLARRVGAAVLPRSSYTRYSVRCSGSVVTAVWSSPVRVISEISIRSCQGPAPHDR